LFELVEAVTPHLAVRFEPVIEFAQRLETKAVEAVLTLRTDPNETGVTKDTQMFRHDGLTQAKTSHEGVDGVLAASKFIQDQSPGRFGNRVNRRIRAHHPSMPSLYMPVKAYT
jgi:hypothetical protein